MSWQIFKTKSKWNLYVLAIQVTQKNAVENHKNGDIGVLSGIYIMPLGINLPPLHPLDKLFWKSFISNKDIVSAVSQYYNTF